MAARARPRGWNRRLLVVCFGLLLGLLPGRAPAAPETARCAGEVRACRRTLCAGLPRERRQACAAVCRSGRCGRPARVRTLAYVATTCRHQADGTTTLQQSVLAQVGDRPPVTLVSLPPSPPVMSDANPCAVFGLAGIAYLAVGPIQRLGVSPDGRTVVFEVEERNRPPYPLPPEAVGFFAVRPDGSGLRRIAPPSRDPAFRTTGILGVPTLERELAFSPDGRLIVYSDLGPGPAGEEVPQAFTLDVGGRRSPVQVTHLPGVPRVPGGSLVETPETIGTPFFVDDETIGFATVAEVAGASPPGSLVGATVRLDGSQLRFFRAFVAVPDGTVVPTFAIAGRRPIVAVIPLSGTDTPPYVPDPGPRWPTSEVFLFDGPNVVQLTTLGRRDTISPLLRTGGSRVFFTSAGNPVGLNPEGGCQIFSIGMFGAGLRQITRFRSEAPDLGCLVTPSSKCFIVLVGQDPDTGAIVFHSSCDPLGTNPTGTQVFAIQPDGTGLRQLTTLAGERTEPDGSTVWQVPGPVAYASPVTP